jgi:soluble lytic murein transglycosylase-like protein
MPHAFAQAAAGDAGGGEEVAFAMPRLAAGGGDIALPQPLAPGEAARVRRIFALQAHGDISAAMAETGRLEDTRLLGAILADRYLRHPAGIDADRLTEWLDRYGHEADAPAIRDLAQRRFGVHAALAGAAVVPPPTADLDRGEMESAGDMLSRNPALDETVRARAREGKAAAALRLIDRTRGMTPRYAAQLRAEVAQILLTRNEDAEALSIALAGVAQSHGEAGLAGSIAGLAAWRQGRFALARGLFETAASARMAAPPLRAGAAFWAARTYLRTHDAAAAAPWMHRAAALPRSFYGLLARRALGMSPLGLGAGAGQDLLSLADVAAVAATSQGDRAFALLQVGQTDRAEAELRALLAEVPQHPAFGHSLLLVIRKAGFPRLAAELAALLQTREGIAEEALIPVPRLVPRGGFQLDPALVYALTRLESNFDPAATSSAGARGLMQIMPLTAGYLAGKPDLAAAFRHRLADPALNLQIGQRYVLYLAQHEAVEGSLIHLLASYNAGPGKVAKWRAETRDGGDPLMFIETIPNDETRAFVQRALAYSWIYAARLGLASPSIDELARGAWPRFRAVPATVH